MGKHIERRTPEQIAEAHARTLAAIAVEVEAKRAAGIVIEGCFPEDESEPTISEAEWREIFKRDKKRG